MTACELCGRRGFLKKKKYGTKVYVACLECRLAMNKNEIIYVGESARIPYKWERTKMIRTR